MSHDKKSNAKNMEKSTILLRRCIYCTSFIFLFIILSFGLYYYGNVYKVKRLNELKNLENQKNITNEKLSGINDKIKIAERFKAIWDKEIEKSKDFNGVNIDYINEIILRLSKANFLTNVQTDTIETSVYRNNQYDSSIKTIVKGIKLNFNCISEHSVYNFIDDFKNNFNGFVVIKSVDINYVKEIDKTFVKNMASGNIDYLMTASITMYLYYIGR